MGQMGALTWPIKIHTTSISVWYIAPTSSNISLEKQRSEKNAVVEGKYASKYNGQSFGVCLLQHSRLKK